MRMQQQQQQQGGSRSRGPKKKPPMNLVVNPRKNSILAHAPPDKMAIIDQAVKVLDVASQGGANRCWRTSTACRSTAWRPSTPSRSSKTLTELGVLDPTTRLQVDKKNKSIIAYAPLADHLTIRALVNKLDGSGRKFEVIQLRRLEADYVAGTIEFMMGGGDKEDAAAAPAVLLRFRRTT